MPSQLQTLIRFYHAWKVIIFFGTWLHCCLIKQNNVIFYNLILISMCFYEEPLKKWFFNNKINIFLHFLKFPKSFKLSRRKSSFCYWTKELEEKPFKSITKLKLFDHLFSYSNALKVFLSFHNWFSRTKLNLFDRFLFPSICVCSLCYIPNIRVYLFKIYLYRADR